ncbi:MAG: hypothetical protein ACQEQC_06660 [Elusimicrobiota bacterium]
MKKFNKTIFVLILMLFCVKSSGYGVSLFDDNYKEDFTVEESTGDTSSEDTEKESEDGQLLEFDNDTWQDIKKDKEEEEFEVTEPGEDMEVEKSTDTEEDLEELPEAEADLPYETRMNITGYKSISAKFGHVFYPYGDEEDRNVRGVPSGATKGFEMDQELRVRIQGKVGDKITVDVDYDDTKPAYNEDARQISVMYKGDPDEIIQKAAFGDVSLSLPSTHFVGYSKNVFGISVEGKHEDFEFTAIGSQTKGRTEVKEFTGQTTFEKRDINDTAYRRRKYYTLDLSTSIEYLPVEQGTLQVYVDDKDDSTIQEKNKSTMTVSFVSSTDTYTGYFYDLVAGRDFTVDVEEGILTFDKNIRENYVVAVTFDYDGGSKSTGPVVLKDENEKLDYEFKNRYDLGGRNISRDDFVLKFLDQDRNRVSLPEGSYEVDYERGLLEFSDRTPFYNESTGDGYEDIYDESDPENHYIIYTEYKRKVRNYSLRPNILKGSERVVLDGQVLTRNVDYTIDYPSGFLAFMDPDRIDETTQIEVTYEYTPFMGQHQETLVGLRGQYNFTRNLYLGGTLLYQWGSASRELPDIQSTPDSTLVLDSDFKFDVPEKYFPFPTSINGEIAKSEYNPNTLGKAMIDNMEGVRQAYSVSTVEDSWQVAATPAGGIQKPEGVTPDGEKVDGWFSLDEEDIYLSEINSTVPETDDRRQRVLKFKYDLPPGGGDKETSIVNPVSREGVDLSDKDSLYVWVKKEKSTQSGELLIDLGIISEDADGTGEWKSEDENRSGTLDKDQDTGWNYIYNGSTIAVGFDNDRLDTNDLDRDGFLDTVEEVNSFSIDIADDLETGWNRVKLLRSGQDSSWTGIKHVRLTVRGEGIAGELGITDLEMVGNRWEAVNSTVTAVNNYDDEDYDTPLEDDIYDEIYREVGGADRDKEQAISLEYSGLEDGATAWAYYDYPRAADFSRHNKISMLVYGHDTDMDYFISFGTEDNYFIKEFKVDYEGWQEKTFKVPDNFLNSGDPKLTNVKKIRLGVLNNSGIAKSGKVWFNELYAHSPQKRMGRAMRGSFTTNVPGIIKVGGSYEEQDKDFQTVTTPPQNQDLTKYSANARLTALPFMDLSGKYSESNVITPEDRITPGQQNEYLKSEDQGEISKKSGRVDTGLNIEHLPDVSGNYSRSVENSDFTGKLEVSESYRGNMSYNFPRTLGVLPDRISGSFRKSDTFESWKDFKKEENPDGGFEDTLKETVEYNGKARFNFLDILSMQPSYKKNIKNREWEFYAGEYEEETKRWPWTKDQDVKLSARLKLTGWFQPRTNYSAAINENYNYKEDGDLSLLSGTKNVNRNFNFDTGVKFPIKRIIPGFAPLDSMNLNINFNDERGETYKNIENSYYTFNKLDHRYVLEPSTASASLETLTRRQTEKYTVNWRPLDYLDASRDEFANFFGGLDSRIIYNRRKSREEETGTVLENFTTLWPDLRLEFGQINSLPFAKDAVKNIRFRSNYKFKETRTVSNSRNISKTINENYDGNCRFLLLEDYDSLVEFSKKGEEKTDLKLEELDEISERFSVSGQLKIPLKEYWDLIVKYTQKSDSTFDYKSEELLTDRKIYTPEVKFDSIIKMPASITVPFINREVKMTNRLKLDSNLKVEISRSELDVTETNTNKYLFNTSTEMDMSSNMRFTLGMGGQYLYNTVKKENSYFAFHMSTDFKIRF